MRTAHIFKTLHRRWHNSDSVQEGDEMINQEVSVDETHSFSAVLKLRAETWQGS